MNNPYSYYDRPPPQNPNYIPSVPPPQYLNYMPTAPTPPTPTPTTPTPPQNPSFLLPQNYVYVPETFLAPISIPSMPQQPPQYVFIPPPCAQSSMCSQQQFYDSPCAPAFCNSDIVQEDCCTQLKCHKKHRKCRDLFDFFM